MKTTLEPFLTPIILHTPIQYSSKVVSPGTAIFFVDLESEEMHSVAILNTFRSLSNILAK